MYAKSYVVANDVTTIAPSFRGQVGELTLNQDVIDACNYRCRFCYAPCKGRLDLHEPFHGPSHTIYFPELLFQCSHPERNKQLSLRSRRWDYAL